MGKKQSTINPARVKRGHVFVAFLGRGGKHRGRRLDRGTERVRLRKEIAC
jgi:hypothetical protein